MITIFDIYGYSLESMIFYCADIVKKFIKKQHKILIDKNIRKYDQYFVCILIV